MQLIKKRLTSYWKGPKNINFCTSHFKHDYTNFAYAI